MVSIKKTAYFFGLVLAVVLFSAFGCKSAEEQAAEDQKTATDPATSVTYDTSTGSTNTTPVIPGPATTDDQTGTGTEDQTQNSDAGTTEGDTTTPSANENGETPEPTPDAGTTVDDQDQVIVKQAEKIVELFGSYTNKSKDAFKNFTDIKPFASEVMKTWLDNAASGTQDPNAPFYGVTTKAVSSAVLDSSANSARILVTTKREEITEQNQTPRTFYALIVVDMLKEGDEWKVNGLYWQ